MFIQKVIQQFLKLKKFDLLKTLKRQIIDIYNIAKFGTEKTTIQREHKEFVKKLQFTFVLILVKPPLFAVETTPEADRFYISIL